jgi:hypothetical protein
MLGKFKDDRRGPGGFSPRLYAVRPKSPLTASAMLESSQHFLALAFLSEAILVSNAGNRKLVTTA